MVDHDSSICFLWRSPFWGVPSLQTQTSRDIRRSEAHEPGGFWWQAAEISGETPFRRHHQGGCKEKHEGAHLPGHFSTRSKSGTICICRSRFLSSRFLVLCGVILPIHPGTIFGAWISMEFPWASPCVLPFFSMASFMGSIPVLVGPPLVAQICIGFPWFPMVSRKAHPSPYPVLQLHWVHHLDGPWDIGFVELARTHIPSSKRILATSMQHLKLP